MENIPSRCKTPIISTSTYMALYQLLMNIELAKPYMTTSMHTHRHHTPDFEAQRTKKTLPKHLSFQNIS